MMPTHATGEYSIVLVQLASAALRSMAVAVAAGLLLATFRVRAARLRLLVWTAVLYAALAIPLLGWILPQLSVPVPGSLRVAAMQVPPSEVVTPGDRPHLIGDLPTRSLPQRQRAAQSAITSQSSDLASESKASQLSTLELHWRLIAISLYFVGALMLLIRFLIGIVVTCWLVRTSREIRETKLLSNIVSRTPGIRSTALPCVRESAAISVPVTVGPIRSTILLPSNWHEWDQQKLDAVIAHEMSHVVRHDALSQCLALLYRALFWFSPLSWWLNRHIAELAEQASDEAALSGGADRAHYARTLLQFFEILQAEPRRIWWQGVSMANSGQAEKRLEKILAWRGAVTMRLKKSALILVIALAVPIVFVAASVRPISASANVSQEPAPSASAPKAPSPAAAVPAEGVTAPSIAAVPSHGPATGVPVPPAAITGVPAVPPMPAAPATPPQKDRDKDGSWYSYGFDDDQRFVIVTGNSESLTMSGSSQDARHVKKLRKQIPGDFIWFQDDEKSYIIRDQATVDRARKLWAPQEELGRKQEELGRQQEALGKQQEALGAKMQEVKVNVPDMTAELDRLKAKLQKLGPNATLDQIGDLQSEIGELQSKLGDLQSHAGDQQSKIGDEMGALGEKQGKLGEQQGELGRQQGELAEKASKEMKQLLDEAIKNGTAKPEVGDSGASL
jgi:beta-lactamase regulating signal transducer with metallopeptidase domain